MTAPKAFSAFAAVVLLAAACADTEPEALPDREYAWAGALGAEALQSMAADTTTPADSVIYAVYTEIAETGRADGILTVLNDSARWRYDPYYGLVGGFMSRDSLDAPTHFLAELTREHDGAACRMSGPVDSLGWWSTELTCGGERVDTVTLHPTANGFVTGTVTSDGTAAEGVRVWYCLVDDGYIEWCRGAAYSGPGGVFRFEAPLGEWFVTFSIWDPIWDDWEHCRSTLSSTARLGRTVTVQLGQATDATADCPWFN